MARITAACALVLLGLLVGTSSATAGRGDLQKFFKSVFPTAALEDDVAAALQGWKTAPVESMLTHKKEEQRNFLILVKYLVRPSDHKDFLKKWVAVAEKTESEKGVRKFTLSKTLDDNLVFYQYAEFAGKEAFAEHIKADYTKKLQEFIFENDIPITVTPLVDGEVYLEMLERADH